MAGFVPPSPWMNPGIAVLDSPIHGRGLTATLRIGQGERVLVWGGACYTDRAGAVAAQLRGRAVMRWDEDVFSFETAGDEDLYAVNHSCDPNAWMADAFTLTARRVILPGEEVTADYALWEMDEDFVSPWTCRCGTAGCRGRVTGNDWRSRALQRRYAGHFSPWIQTLIRSVARLEDSDPVVEGRL